MNPVETSILPQKQQQPQQELIDQIQQHQNKEQNLQKIDEDKEDSFVVKIGTNKPKLKSSSSVNRSVSRSVSSNEYESIDSKIIEEVEEDLKGNIYYQQIYSNNNNNNNNGGDYNAKANNIYNV